MKLQWEDKYSVKVKILDDQHKMMFETINKLVEMLSSGIPKKEDVDKIVHELVKYKKFHFVTEEKYFDEFNYENSQEHKLKHREFNLKLDKFVVDYNDDPITLAYALVDFLEDWLLDHLMTEDQKYVECFTTHGLK